MKYLRFPKVALIATCLIVGSSANAFGLPVAAHPPCLNSDGTACPASYFTGPLGARNPVPPNRGAFLLEEFGGIPTTWPQKQAGIVAREKAIGRTFDAIHIQYADGTWGGVKGMEDPTQYQPRKEQWAIKNGSSFVAVSWSPDFTIAQMNNGDADAIWAKAATYWKSYSPTPIMLRSFVEFNLPTVYGAVPSEDNGNKNYCGKPFQTAWQRMVKVFKQAGATNVGFWFTPDDGNNRQCVIDSYPGDQYVDWVGSDSYNRCAVKEADCYSTPLHAGAATFGELFNYPRGCASGACPKSQLDLFGPRKPFVVGETGTVYDPANTAMKGNFYKSALAGAKQMKYLRGISFFDQNVSAAEGAKANWWVNQPANVASNMQGFRQMATDPWFNTRLRTVSK